MKNLKQHLKQFGTGTLIALSLCGAKAFAQGDRVGNGGGGHLCYMSAISSDIKSIESYDLWEGQKVHKLDIAAWDGQETKEQIIARSLAKIARTQPGFARDMKRVLPLLSSDLVVDVSDFTLDPTPDVRRLMIGKNCVYQQIVNWLEKEDLVPGSEEKILRDGSSYNGMNALNQAALDLHEAAYKVARTYGNTNISGYGTREIRKFIAETFSSGPVSIVLVPKTEIEESYELSYFCEKSLCSILHLNAVADKQFLTSAGGLKDYKLEVEVLDSTGGRSVSVERPDENDIWNGYSHVAMLSLGDKASFEDGDVLQGTEGTKVKITFSHRNKVLTQIHEFKKLSTLAIKFNITPTKIKE